jgi:hypothetical protein
MLPYIKILKENGISYQLNFQNFLGAVHGGGDFTEKMCWENIVDNKGNSALGVACPIGKTFREKTAKRLITWANTHPDIIWIDDDFRLHNHGASTLMQLQGKSGYTDYYCFCDNHINEFNKLHGTSFDRETLVKEMLKSIIESSYSKTASYPPVDVLNVADDVEVTVDDHGSKYVVHLLDYNVKSKAVSGAKMFVPGKREIKRIWYPDTKTNLEIAGRTVVLRDFESYDLVVVEFK